MKTKIYVALLFAMSAFTSHSQTTYYEESYKATVLTSDFILPAIRFNRLETEGHPRGKLSAFNSIGAGLTLSYGRLNVRYQDSSRTTVLTDEPLDYNNLVGVQVGFLFAVNSATEENVSFAPTIAISVLDFSLGWGYEWGTLAENHEGHFFTISYNVPARKLFNKGLLVFYKKAAANNKLINLSR